ncbi:MULTISPECIES: hypothetical protein [Mucilaginibacter]|nr:MULTISPECIES: hypothetical protein [Mucilaginibacter]
MRKIKQAEENEKKQQAKDNLSHLEISFFHRPDQILFIAPVISTANEIAVPRYAYQYSSRYIETIFRPPKSIA